MWTQGRKSYESKSLCPERSAVFWPLEVLQRQKRNRWVAFPWCCCTVDSGRAYLSLKVKAAVSSVFSWPLLCAFMRSSTSCSREMHLDFSSNGSYFQSGISFLWAGTIPWILINYDVRLGISQVALGTSINRFKQSEQRCFGRQRMPAQHCFHSRDTSKWFYCLLHLRCRLYIVAWRLKTLRNFAYHSFGNLHT